MKNFYNIVQGKHFSKGKKEQEFIWPLIMLFVSISMFFINGINILIPFIGILFFIILLIITNLRMNKSEIKVIFKKNCIYTLKNNYDQINKLYGISLYQHHFESIRIGWRCINSKSIELFAYYYIDGVRGFKKIYEIDTEKEVNIQINILKDDYHIDLQSDSMPKANFSIKKGKEKRFLKLFKYTLYPYFGGTEPAPNSMDILIEKN